MRADQHIVSQSLLPYLDPLRSKVLLRILAEPCNSADGREKETSFPSSEPSGPFSRLLQGHFSTDAGSEVQKVFLLAQRDRYAYQPNRLWPLTNPDMDRIWQEAFQFHAAQFATGGLILLSSHFDAENHFAPFRSLFFCKLERVFFHPPCPECGSLLEQCYEDVILRDAGLHPYTSSLERYLFCPACFSNGVAVRFYTYELDHGSTPFVEDRFSLITRLGRLRDNGALSETFPCTGCARNSECNSSDILATARMVPFGFYPFFMLVLKALPYRAPEFLALLSGASHNEVKGTIHGVAGPPLPHRLTSQESKGMERPFQFLFEGDHRAFLELLYLKLLFLRQVVGLTFSQPKIQRQSDVHFSLDHFFVEIPNHEGLFPAFWNFTVRPLGIGLEAKETCEDLKVPTAFSLYALGLVWFYALLADKSYPFERVRTKLAERLERELAATVAEGPAPKESGWLQAFPPEYIFWDPSKNEVRMEYGPFWEEALALGMEVLKASFTASPRWSQEAFLHKLLLLSDRIKEILFKPQIVEKPPADNEADGEIRQILKGIMDRWRADLDLTTPHDKKIDAGLPIESEPKGGEGHLDATTILTLDGQPGLRSDALHPPHEKDSIEKTTIIPTTGVRDRSISQTKRSDTEINRPESPAVQSTPAGDTATGETAETQRPEQVRCEETAPAPSDRSMLSQDGAAPQETTIIDLTKLESLLKKERRRSG
jgi:hypothetical protein